jgi:hypothetical protein
MRSISSSPSALRMVLPQALVALLLTAGACGGNKGGGGPVIAPPGTGGAPGTGGGTGGAGTSTGGVIGAGSGGTPAVDAASGAGGEGALDAGVPAGTGGAGPVNPAAFEPCTDAPAMMPPALKKTPVAMVPAQPNQIVGVPGDPSIVYVVGHKTGNIYIIQDGKLLDTPLVHMDILTNNQNEQGLLSMALHPDFLKNGLFYLLATVAGGNIHIEEFQRMTPTTAKATGNVIFDKARVKGGAFHNGGSLYFSPKDGGKPLLYHSAGNNLSPPDSAKPDGIAGRILRHDLDAKTFTTVAYGLRNPYRMSIDRLTGDMWISDTGDPPGGVIYYLAGGSKDGTNFGYGSGGDVGSKYASMGGHQGGGGGIIGGVVYRGHKIKGLCGRYFFGMWNTGVIRSIVQQDGKVVGGVFQHPGDLSVPSITAFGEDGEGEIYMSSQNGPVYKLEAAGQ